MNSQQLNRQARDLQARAASDRKEAERHNYNAESYREHGDETRAAVEADKASRLLAEADGYESESQQLFETSLALDARARQLESEKKQVQAEYESRIKEIERKQQNLTGGGSALI